MNGPSTRRRREIAKAFSALAPLAPFADAEPIREAAAARKMRQLPATIAVWIATIAHIRHAHTAYDALLEEGYDREAARFFVIDEINEILTDWRTTRLLDPDDDE